MCALNGGNIVQDCTGHAIGSTHGITNGEITLQITSTHHQMQDPYGIDPKYYKVLFWAEMSLSGHYYGAGVHASQLEYKEPEIVEYHVPGKPKCLAIQGHPEMIPGTQTAKYLDKLLQNFVKINE